MIVLLRPWWGLNVNGDMAGDFGLTDADDQVLPDCTLVYAASVLSNGGWPVTLLDDNAEHMGSDVLRRRVFELRPNRVFVKVAAPTCTKDLRFAEQLKQESTSTEVFVFGACVATLAAEVLARFPVDGVVVGDPNRVMRDLLDGCADGIWTRNRPSRATYATHTLKTMDDVPTARYDLAPYQRYRRGSAGPFAFTMTSLGCPHNCAHCPYVSVYGTTWRAKSAAGVVEELASLSRLGIRYVQFRDMTFTFDRQRVADICAGITAANLNLQWACETRVDRLHEDLVEQMARAGCYQIQFGVETGDAALLEKIGRTSCSKHRVGGAISWMHRHGIEPYVFFMIGFPGETEKTIQSTIDLALELNCACRCSPLYVYPNSRLGRSVLGGRKVSLDELERYDYERAASTVCGLTEQAIKAAKDRFDRAVTGKGLSLVPRDPPPLRRLLASGGTDRVHR